MHTLDRINADPMILPNISLGCEIRWKLRPHFVMTRQCLVGVWVRGQGSGVVTALLKPTHSSVDTIQEQ